MELEFLNACYSGDIVTVKKFINNGIDPNLVFHNRTGIFLAISQDHNDIVDLLIKNGAKIDSSNLYTAINSNKYNGPGQPVGNDQLVDILLNGGANPNVIIHKITPLMAAIFKKNIRVIEVLLKHNADIDTKINGHTALTLTNDKKIITLLLKYKKFNDKTSVLHKKNIKLPTINLTDIKTVHSTYVVKYFEKKYKNNCSTVILNFNVIDEKNNSEDLIDDIKKCDKRFVVVPLGLKFDEESGHSNMLIIDKDEQCIERFEPMGVWPGYLDLIVNQFLNNLSKQLKYKYIYPHCDLTFQQIQEKEHEITKDDPAGFCNAWSLWYAELRLSNPDMDRKQLLELSYQVLHEQKEKTSFTTFIKAYSKYVLSVMNKKGGTKKGTRCNKKTKKGTKCKNFKCKIHN